MPRARTLSDEAIHATIRRLLAEGGDKAVSFGTVSQATGLAASTLAQRFATRDGMVRAALLDGWAHLSARTEAAEAEVPAGGKQVAALLKLVARDSAADIALRLHHLRDPDLRAAAQAWRSHMEQAIALRLAPDKAAETAAMVFALWQGRLLWSDAGEPPFRLKDALRRLS